MCNSIRIVSDVYIQKLIKYAEQNYWLFNKEQAYHLPVYAGINRVRQLPGK